MHTLTHFENSRLGRPIQAFLTFLILFVGLGSPQRALAQLINESITISSKPTTGALTTTSYSGRALDDVYFFQPRLGGAVAEDGTTITATPFLGTFDFEGNSSISIDAGFISAAERAGRPPGVTRPVAARILYRVTLNGSAPNAGPIRTPEFIRGSNNARNESTFSISGLNIDLLSAAQIKSGGSYTIEIIFEETQQNGITDASNIYTLAFDVTAPAVAPPGTTTTWVGGTPGALNDWLTPTNWTNGVPTAAANAIIPSPPRQFSPILNDPNATYAVRNLVIQATNPSDAFTQRGILRITTARLKVYGNIANGGNGILATTDAQNAETNNLSGSAVVEFAGADQSIDRGRFANVIISNNVVTASGNTVTISPNPNPAVKSLFGVLDNPGTLQFTPGVKAVLRTSVTSDNGGTPILSTTGDQFVEIGTNGTVLGETNFAFVLGVLKTTGRPVAVGTPNTFGNIGIDINIRNASVANGTGSITRTTGTSFSPLRNPDGSIPTNSARSVKRTFGNSFSFLQAGLVADVTLHYNDSDNFADGQIDELNTNVSGFLRIFRTTSGSTFENLGGVDRTPDQRQAGAPTTFSLGDPAVRGFGGTVTQSGLNNINTLTLADFRRPLPLPVDLTAFDVKRSGSDAVLTWTTAMEKNSKGFNVQVSTDGKLFRNLGFVASGNGTSVGPQQYRFVDAEAGKIGTRYYRLHQVDLDGKSALSGVRAVKFDGTAVPGPATTLLAYPNPFTSELSVSVAGAGNGAATLRLTDLTGRLIRVQQVQLGEGSSTLTLPGLSDLKTGVYMVQLLLPSGKTQNFKVQKQ